MKTFLEYRQRLETLFHQLGQEGHRQFAILGDGEILFLVEMGLSHSIPEARFRRVEPDVVLQPGEILLDCRLNGETDLGISVMTKLLHMKGASV